MYLAIDSGMNASKSQPPNAINDEKSSYADASKGTSEKRDLETADYVSSLRTVALCVCINFTIMIACSFKFPSNL